MFRRFSTNFALLSMLLDALAVALALWLAAAVRPSLGHLLGFLRPIPAGTPIPLPLFVIFPLVCVVIFSVFSIYDGRKYLKAVDELAALTLASLVLGISMAGILYLSYRDVSRALFIFFMAFTYLEFLGWRSLARLYFKVRGEPAESQRRVLIVGTGRLGQQTNEQISQQRPLRLDVVGFVSTDGAHATHGLKVLGRRQDLPRIAAAERITDVVIALPHSEYHIMADVVASLERAPLRVWVALGFFDLALYKTDIEDVGGIPMLDLRASALNDYERLVKRGFDLAVGALSLVLALPLMGLISMAILLEDGRPILFRQRRVGENGRVITVHKFRSMVKNAEELRGMVERTDEDGNLIHKSQEDPRVTRVGRFLRRTSLDELPQLLNVLRGEMSLVGPRPELPYLVERYQPWQRKRFAVPPGMTGWWQITGRSDKPMHLHTEDDLFYIANYSIWLDIQILVRTVWVVVVGRGSF